jgi:hypothetical protein
MNQIGSYFAMIISGGLILLSLYIIFCNWSLMFIDYYYKVHSSLIPLLGGLLGSVGLLFSLPSARQYWWLPLMVDPGCFFLFAGALIYQTIRWMKRIRHDDVGH